MIVRTRVDIEIVVGRLGMFLPPVELSVRDVADSTHRKEVSLTENLAYMLTTDGEGGILTLKEKQIFGDFLQGKGVLKEYIYCMVASDNTRSGTPLSMGNLLTYAFNWSSTPKGHEGWQRLHDQWVNYYHSNTEV